jgi:MSHA biogenesis protein MshO
MPALYFPKTKCRQRGFTLVELIIVIVIMGVIGGMVSVFMRSPIDAYFSTARRAGLADEADGTLRRMSRDIRKSLPNSIVVASDGKCVDFIPTKTGGRYRADDTSAGLKFTAADDTFNMLGSNPTDADQTIQIGDVVVVYNQGITGSDAYAGNTTAVISGVAAAVGANPAETTISIASKLFPLASPGNRFQVVPATERVVSYACTAQRTLVRAVNTASFAKNCQPGGTITASGTVRVSVMAQNVDQGACSFVYDSNAQRDGLLRLRLQMTDSGETVSLQHQIHVDNTP